ncbi:hypothetical protein ACYFX5_25370 [Bremerella sp. T1]|uniref:hypothetical protein n=1 Tax=Bremerella sp. TYQ1 TaxID=3119568 RepID=UPI001CCA8461|nr:hypothetical protein [Bremerella volcania]UBM36347.1 hypothetical protein LA756_00225 [Bremerella volcania]
MHASELCQQVAHATGESIQTIRRLGFSLVEEFPAEIDDEMLFGPNMVDWDEVEVARTQLQDGIERNVPSAA